MPRLLGVDIPNEKRIDVALQYLYGVGPAVAKKCLDELAINPTVRAKDLKDRLKTPLEDTQLAVYALLMDADPALQAAYLAMDEPEALVTVPHPEVSVTAQVLRDGLQADLSAVLAGQPLPALGEGRVCDYCEARGLCRKDDLA